MKTHVWGLPIWVSIPVGVIFVIVGFLVLWFSRKNFQKNTELKKSFETKFNALPKKMKNQFSKDDYWLSNTTMWMRSRHILLPLIGMVVIGIGISIVLGIVLLPNL